MRVRSERAFILILNEARWEEKSRMSEQRVAPSCGRIDNFVTGKEEVVVAGGYYHGDLQSVEIYSVHNDLWRQGNPLPNKIGFASYLPFEDSFIIIGGRSSSSTSLDTIYKVSCIVPFEICHESDMLI